MSRKFILSILLVLAFAVVRPVSAQFAVIDVGAIAPNSFSNT